MYNTHLKSLLNHLTPDRLHQLSVAYDILIEDVKGVLYAEELHQETKSCFLSPYLMNFVVERYPTFEDLYDDVQHCIGEEPLKTDDLVLFKLVYQLLMVAGEPQSSIIFNSEFQYTEMSVETLMKEIIRGSVHPSSTNPQRFIPLNEDSTPEHIALFWFAAWQGQLDKLINETSS